MKTVFVDVDTQLDFVVPAGALYVPGAERIIPAVARLNAYAASHGIPVLSTTDAHAENDPEFQNWPPHCVAGTLGQRKPASTLLPRRSVVSTRPGNIPTSLEPQVIVEKQALDAFTNPNLTPLLERLGAERYAVYGVVTEYCVRCAAMGLLKTGAEVLVVTDAVQTLNEQDGRRTIEELTGGGAKLTTVSEITGG